MRSQIISHKLIRAERQRRIIRFKSEVGGLIPYLQRQALEVDGVATSPLKLPRAAPVTKTFEYHPPMSVYGKHPYVHECKHTMRHIGKMDGYIFGTSIPKFDPWVRDLIREIDPMLEQTLTSTYLRDPSSPERIMKHFSRYDQKWRTIPKGKRMDQAKTIVTKMFSAINELDPIDFNFDGWAQIVPQLEMSSSPGLPLRREFATQADCLPYIYDKAKRLNHFAKFLAPHKVRAPPCMIGLRPGLTEYEVLDEKVKARGVWAYPAEVKVLEMRYTKPIMDRIKQLFGDIPYTTGVNMTKCLPMVIDHLLVPGKKGAVFDVSHLDDSVGPEYIDWAFEVIGSWFDFGITPSSITRDKNVFEFLKYYFKNTLILLPSGQLVRKAGGVPSGSGFTQLVDTLVSILITVYSLLKQGLTEEEIIGQLFAVGDDVAVTVPTTFDLQSFSKSFKSLGFELNVDKIMFTDDSSKLIFLGYSKQGGHVRRELIELLKQALFPERFVGSEGRSYSRLIGQFIACGMCDSGFSRLLDRAFEKRLYAPLSIDEDYLSQSRWVKRFMNETEELPNFPDVHKMWTLV